MFHFIIKKVNQVGSTGNSTTHFCFLQNPSLRFISHISSSTKGPSFTVSYLINSCGLSPETAVSLSEKINLETREKPDLVLTFLKNNGFTKTHISNLICKVPALLLVSPEKTLKPKIDLFRSRGISGPLLGKIICSNPYLLRRSVKNQLIPALDFLKSFVHTDENVIDALRRPTQLLRLNTQKVIVPKIAILQNNGVPRSRILKLIMVYSRTLGTNNDKFSKIVVIVKDMGFNPLASAFILAVWVMSVMSKSTWERKLRIYRSLGWSKDETHLAFRRQPLCMVVSEEKLRKCMDFFVNKLHCNSNDIAMCPNILLLSLEKRILPRCRVVRILMSNGLIKKDMALAWLLIMAEKKFVEKFVIRYQEEVPEILKAYQGKVGLVAFDIGSEELAGFKML